MKFILLLKVCSALTLSCQQPIQHPTIFDTWYECATTGYMDSLKFVNNLGQEYINKNNVIIQFSCQKIKVTES